jgi:hypothetical protein
MELKNNDYQDRHPLEMVNPNDLLLDSFTSLNHDLSIVPMQNC